ncbi:MAG: hypothetical protein D6732_04095 [Methanobacteriota archaeon]|nr:MAG: hypothetical protein D6732_04095 [Euryarchaeota archaeon]
MKISIIADAIVVENNANVDIHYPLILPFVPLKLNVVSHEKYRRFGPSYKKRMADSRQMPLLINDIDHETTLKHVSVQHYVKFLVAFVNSGIPIRVIKKENQFIVLAVFHEKIIGNKNRKDLENKINEKWRRLPQFPKLSLSPRMLYSLKKYPFFAFNVQNLFKHHRKWLIPFSTYGMILDRLASEFQVPDDQTETFSGNEAIKEYEDNGISVYVFSVRKKKYRLENGNVLLVYGPIHEIGEWFPHVLARFRDRLLWLGNFPERNGVSRQIDFQKYRVDFLNLLKRIDVGSDVTFFGNYLWRITQMKSFRKAFRKLLTIIEQKGLGQGLNNVPFSRIIEAFGHPEVSQAMSEGERRFVYATFIQLDNYRFLDPETASNPLVFEEFGYLWHSLRNPNIIQMLFEAYILLKFASIHDMGYSLLVVEDQDAALHLLESNALELIQSEFPDLKIILSLKECKRVSNTYHQLIIGKHQVSQFLPNNASARFPKTINLYRNPAGKGFVHVAIDNFPISTFTNEFDPLLLEEGSPPSLLSPIQEENEEVRIVLQKIIVDGNTSLLSSHKFSEKVKEHVDIALLLEKFPIIGLSKGFDLTEVSSTKMNRLKRSEIREIQNSSIERAVERGFVLTIGKGYSSDSDQFEITENGIKWYHTLLQKIRKDFIDLVVTLPNTFEIFDKVGNKVKELMELRQLSNSRIVHLKLLEYGFMAFAYGNFGLHVPALLLGLYSLFDPKIEFSEPEFIDGELDSLYRLRCVSLKTKVLELFQTQSNQQDNPKKIEMEEENRFENASQYIDELPNPIPSSIKTSAPSIPEILKFMKESKLTTVVLPKSDNLSLDQKISVIKEIPINGFFTESSSKKLGSFRSMKLGQLLEFSKEEIENEISEPVIAEKLYSLKSKCVNQKFVYLFSQLDAYYKKLTIATGIRIPKSLLPHDIVIPMSDDNTAKIREGVNQSSTNLEIFGRFFHIILLIWCNNEQLRLKITKKTSDASSEWIKSVTSLDVKEFTPHLLTEMNRLIQAFQEFRGGMEIKEDSYKMKPTPFMVSVGYFRLNRLWKLIEENDPESNKRLIFEKIHKIVEYRS